MDDDGDDDDNFLLNQSTKSRRWLKCRESVCSPQM